MGAARAVARQLDAETRSAIATAARAEQMRRSFAAFVRGGWHVLDPETPLEWNWHHDVVCEQIQGVLMDWLRWKKDRSFRQRVKNMLVNMPPGTTKSRIISVFAMAWMWLHAPSWSVLCLSANPDVAMRDAMFARDLVTSDWYRETFGITWTIREDQDQKGKYRNTVGGERTSKGITSKITGNRADAIFIDDPNDMDEVYSEAERKKVNGKFDNAIYNRVNDQRSAVRVVMQQRGHVDDLSGHWLRKVRNVTIVDLPMEAQNDNLSAQMRKGTPYGVVERRTTVGEALQPSRFTPEFLAEERERLGTFGYEAQYNQRPAQLDAGMIKRRWWRFFVPPGFDAIVQSRPEGCNDNVPSRLSERVHGARDDHWTKRLELDWWSMTVDASFGSTSDTASAVAIQVVAGRGADRFVFVDSTKVRTFFETLAEIARLLQEYPAINRVLVEKRANGAPVIEVFQRDIPGFIGIEPMGKMPGAVAMSPAIESGNVYLLEGAPWLQEFVDELSMFPKGKRDDRVDALAQLMAYHAQDMSELARWKALAG